MNLYSSICNIQEIDEEKNWWQKTAVARGGGERNNTSESALSFMLTDSCYLMTT
jgi:hypothetical protein